MPRRPRVEGRILHLFHVRFTPQKELCGAREAVRFTAKKPQKRISAPGHLCCGQRRTHAAHQLSSNSSARSTGTWIEDGLVSSPFTDMKFAGLRIGSRFMTDNAVI